MLRRKPALLLSVSLFFTAETILGILFQTGFGNGAHLRYATVVLACLFCVLFAERTWDYLLTQLALVATVCADFFLVLPPAPNQLPGMLFFSVAQLSYAACLALSERRPRLLRAQLWLRGILSVVALAATVAVLGKRTDAIALVSVFYYANLILNLIFAWTQLPRRSLMAAGLTLFLCCDTVIGLAFLDGYLPISQAFVVYRIIYPGFDLAWAFYLPSQMLLAVSLLPTHRRASRSVE
ncbi:MAG: hypothetical protein IKM33_04495 [Clostridia bacterium]|nr:hypothetical protein [Clostridia bacterium]